jgi:hypothetical protein
MDPEEETGGLVRHDGVAIKLVGRVIADQVRLQSMDIAQTRQKDLTNAWHKASFS